MTEPRRSRTSRSVQIVTLSALALTVQGCGDDEYYCVDRNNIVVDSEDCLADDSPIDDRGHFWVVGGKSKSKKIVKGAILTGGKRDPAWFKNSTIRSAMSRGGFGRSGGGGGVGIKVSGGG